MEDTLKELCREARDRQNITIQDLADETGISISTIGNFFATKSKAPNVYNAGAICAALGVSLDKYFGIEPVITTEDELAQANEQLAHQKQIHDADVHIAHLEGGMEQMAKTIDYQRKKTRITQFAIYGLMLVCAIFLAVIVGYIFFDYRVPHQGLIQGGEASIFAWIVFLLLAVGIGIFTAVFIVALRYTKDPHARP
nr:MAG TPA: helix-turn-helix XRE-family like protein [Bacteriophage sp.]